MLHPRVANQLLLETPAAATNDCAESRGSSSLADRNFYLYLCVTVTNYMYGTGVWGVVVRWWIRVVGGSVDLWWQIIPLSENSWIKNFCSLDSRSSVTWPITVVILLLAHSAHAEDIRGWTPQFSFIDIMFVKSSSGSTNVFQWVIRLYTCTSMSQRRVERDRTSIQ